MPPGGSSVTVPSPTVPTVNVYSGTGATTKFALMLVFPLIVTLAGFAVPLSAPLQPANVQPAAGNAVNSTTEPTA